MCPLPWLEEAEDVQYNFDDVFIPLRTIDIDIEQRTGDLSGPSGSSDSMWTGDLSGPSGSSDSMWTGDLPGPSGSSDGMWTGDLPGPSGSSYGMWTGDLPGPSGSSYGMWTGDLPGPSGSSDGMWTGDLSGPSRDLGVHHQTRYKYHNVILLYYTYLLYRLRATGLPSPIKKNIDDWINISCLWFESRNVLKLNVDFISFLTS